MWDSFLSAASEIFLASKPPHKTWPRYILETVVVLLFLIGFCWIAVFVFLKFTTS